MMASFFQRNKSSVTHGTSREKMRSGTSATSDLIWLRSLREARFKELPSPDLPPHSDRTKKPGRRPLIGGFERGQSHDPLVGRA